MASLDALKETLSVPAQPSSVRFTFLSQTAWTKAPRKNVRVGRNRFLNVQIDCDNFIAFTGWPNDVSVILSEHSISKETLADL